MKTYALLLMVCMLSYSCNGQTSESTNVDPTKGKEKMAESPKGTWKVDKEFDEHGNLIRYDSIYSWSTDGRLENFSSMDKDSLMASFKSRFFTNFSGFEDDGFEAIFSEDSLFSKRFFNDDFFSSDFGQDFMDIDKMRQHMIARQKRFLEKYQSEFIKPEDEN